MVCTRLEMASFENDFKEAKKFYFKEIIDLLEKRQTLKSIEVVENFIKCPEEKIKNV